MEPAIALIHEEKGVFGVSFPDFPGAITTADSLDDALRRGAEMIAFHVSGMIEDGLPLPRLRSHAELKRDKDFRSAAKGAVVAAIPVALPGRAVRVNVTIDESLLAAIDRAAQASGESRSAFLAGAAKRRLARAEAAD
jgi:predicted RNase H-like HicB family nuclease